MSTLKVDTIEDKAGAFEHARLVQVVSEQSTAIVTGTTQMPSDNTIPQNTEGVECETITITPTHASNILHIISVHQISHTASALLGIALFQDSTSSALAAECYSVPSSAMVCSLNHTMTAGTTSATTFKIRVGRNDTGTVTYNGQGCAARFGAIPCSSIIICEVRA